MKRTKEHSTPRKPVHALVEGLQQLRHHGDYECGCAQLYDYEKDLIDDTIAYLQSTNKESQS